MSVHGPGCRAPATAESLSGTASLMSMRAEPTTVVAGSHECAAHALAALTVRKGAAAWPQWRPPLGVRSPAHDHSHTTFETEADRNGVGAIIASPVRIVWLTPFLACDTAYNASTAGLLTIFNPSREPCESAQPMGLWRPCAS